MASHLLELYDGSSDRTYRLIVTAEIYERAQEDYEYANKLLQQAINSAPQSSPHPSQIVDKYNLSPEPDVTMELLDGSTATSEEVEHDVCSTDITEALIMAVSTKPLLYDFRIPLKQRSKAMTAKKWEEVYQEIGEAIPLKDLPNKFKNLRDRYIALRSEYRKKGPSGTGAKTTTPKWKYFELLNFIGDTLVHARTHSSLNTPKEDHDVVSHEELTSGIASVCTSSIPTGTKKAKRNSDNSQLEEVIMSGLTMKLDATDHFCQSLADHLKSFDLKSNMQLQMKIMQLVFAEKFKE